MGNVIKVWISSNALIGAFYPIIYISFNEAKNSVSFRAKMNKVGLALALMVNILIIPAALNLFILGDRLSFDILVRRIIVCIFFVGIFNFPIYMSYKGARDVLKTHIKEVLGK